MKKHAFTLAEVLITLGVIGVVAAITMPTLIKNYQKTVWTNQLKKVYVTSTQAFKKMMADDGVDNLSNTSVFLSVNGSCYGSDGVNSSNCTQLYQNLKKYFKIIAIENTGNYQYSSILKGSSKKYPDNKTTGTKIVLSDGSFMMRFQFHRNLIKSSNSCDTIRSKGGSMCDYVSKITFDVNGNKGPNIEGRDIFNFYVGGNGLLYPFWGKDDLIFNEGNDSRAWYNNVTACGTKGIADAETKSTYGSGCAARIIDNGWKMDY